MVRMPLDLLEFPALQSTDANDLGDEVDGHEPRREDNGPDETGTRIQKNADQEAYSQPS